MKTILLGITLLLLIYLIKKLDRKKQVGAKINL